MSTIHLAAALGDVERVRALLREDPARANTRGGADDCPPLLYACCPGQHDPATVDARIAIARALIAAGADVNACGRERATESAERAESDVESWTALEGAVGRIRSVALVRVLLDAGADPQRTSALLKLAVHTRDLRVLEVALAANPPWWQVTWALVACADLDLPAQARLLVPHAHAPTSLAPGLVRALREERGMELVTILLGDDTPSPQRRAVEDAAYRAARRYRRADAAALLRARGATDDVLSPTDRAIAGEPVTGPVKLHYEDHRMLSWAIAKRHFALVPQLLAIGLDPNAHDETGELPLGLAMRAGTHDVVAQLRAAGADPAARSYDAAVSDQPALFECAAAAVVDGDLATLREILDRQPALVAARSPRPHRCTLLHYTAANGTERQASPANAGAIAEHLLARGADPNATCRLYGGGATTLGLMLTSAHPRAANVDGDLVRALTHHGARVDEGDLDVAVQHASPRAALALVEAGAPMTLLVAAALDRADLVEDFLRTTDVNTRFADGYTALHAAAGMGHHRTVELLLARGADRTLVDTHWGGTAADKARYFAHAELAAFIERY